LCISFVECRESIIIDKALNEKYGLLSLIRQIMDGVIGIVTTIRPENPRGRGLIPVTGKRYMYTYSPKRPIPEVHLTSN
jgi:hypothetical protein